jgi:hypothetical protein
MAYIIIKKKYHLKYIVLVPNLGSGHVQYPWCRQNGNHQLGGYALGGYALGIHDTPRLNNFVLRVPG